MNQDDMSMDQRRVHLAAEIAKQRSEFAKAYHNLATPIHYTEQAMRGFGFLRQNPWVLSIVPAIVSIGSALLGLRKPKSKPRSKMSLRERRELERDAEKETKGLFGHAVKWGGRGFKLFKTYRRLRHLFQ